MFDATPLALASLDRWLRSISHRSLFPDTSGGGFSIINAGGIPMIGAIEREGTRLRSQTIAGTSRRINHHARKNACLLELLIEASEDCFCCPDEGCFLYDSLDGRLWHCPFLVRRHQLELW